MELVDLYNGQKELTNETVEKKNKNRKRRICKDTI